MSVFGHIAIVANLSLVIDCLDAPFICKMGQIPVDGCQPNPVVKEFLVELLGCWMVVSSGDCVVNGPLLPCHPPAGLVRLGRVAHVNASS